MHEQLIERKAMVAAGDIRADAFSIMVKANQDESTYKLDDEEVVRPGQISRHNGHQENLRSATLSFSCSRVTVCSRLFSWGQIFNIA
jgi:hypothetical protein